MKRIIVILAFLAVMSSCGVMQPKGEIVRFLDYRPYTEAGIFLSPYNYTGKYEPIGQIDIEVYPEQVTDGIYISYKEVTADQLLEKAVKHSLGKGANGIANLSIKTIYNVTYNRYGSSRTLSHYEITGFLIRITDNQ